MCNHFRTRDRPTVQNVVCGVNAMLHSEFGDFSSEVYQVKKKKIPVVESNPGHLTAQEAMCFLSSVPSPA